MKKLSDKAKKAVISAGAGVAAAAILAGVIFGLRGRGEPVGVYPFSVVGMTEFWGDNQESYGPVTTDRIQTVFLSDTQTITEVLVKEGDKVKKGDVLMTYDTTLSELQLERKRLDVEKAKLQVKEAEEELARINAMKPMGNVDVSIPVVDKNWGEKIGASEILAPKESELVDSQIGKSKDVPLVCWASGNTELDNVLLGTVYQKFLAYSSENPGDRTGSSASALLEEEQLTVNQDKENLIVKEEQENKEIPDEHEKPEDNETPGDKKNPNDNTNLNDEENLGNTQNPVNDAPPQTVQYTISFREKTVSGSWAEVGTRTSDCTVGDILSSETVARELTYDGKVYRLQYFSVNGGGGQADVTVGAGQNIVAVYTFELRASRPKLNCPLVADGKIVVKQGELVSIPITFTVDNGDSEETVNWRFERDDQLAGTAAGRSYFLYGIPGAVGTKPYSVTATYGSGLSDTLNFDLVVTENAEEKPVLNNFYMVLRVTEEDRRYAPIITWQGIHVTVYGEGTDRSYGMRLFDAASVADPFAKEEEDITLPDIDFGSGMTAAEIAKLRRAQEKKIKELAAAAKMTESEYNLMVREFTDGNIRATLDGVVVSLLAEEEARQAKQPVMKVSGGGGFYVQGSVSELEKDRLKLGQEVTVSDWNTGMTYTGQVEAIGDFPVQGEGWNGVGNPNASYYPFRVFIDGTADLREESYVSVTYSAAEAENGIYLENPFLRTDDGEPYVYVRGKNGRLEKRTVTTGKSLWGSFTEIRSGLTADDYVAFPYGKTVKPGAATVESDLSALYGF